MLVRCQPGYESLLAQELAWRGAPAVAQGGGWVRTAAPPADAAEEFAFAHLCLLDERELAGESVNQLAGAIADYFLGSARTERFDGPWPFVVETAAGLDGLGRRASAVESAILEALKKKISRVARLAVPELPIRSGRARGLFVYFVEFKRVVVAREAILGGARRMADDPLAPSRSYLKVEEAYGLLGREPAEGETVCDLGAAPGGWSYSAAKRGARVVAIDNGPLKGGALDHPRIEHRREDAFKAAPPEGEAYDWLFCDMVEEPHQVLTRIVEPWLARGWCRRFVINLKFGRVDPVALLRELETRSPFATHATGVRVRHLYHDREEFTVVGECRG